eukprot:snap_masked-scaffold_124-processed-gene-0.9-mRNA-1 protein AED:1.00 eAED:1.00 QI:0/0/0/0/1/1/2/0/138
MSEVYFYGLHRKNVSKLLNTFRRKCLHCNRSPRLTRQSYRLPKLVKKPREILRADYLYVNSVIQQQEKYRCLFQRGASASSMVDALLTWRENYGFLQSFLIVTDNGSHFANGLLSKLSRAVGFSQVTLLLIHHGLMGQ